MDKNKYKILAENLINSLIEKYEDDKISIDELKESEFFDKLEFNILNMLNIYGCGNDDINIDEFKDTFGEISKVNYNTLLEIDKSVCAMISSDKIDLASLIGSSIINNNRAAMDLASSFKMSCNTKKIKLDDELDGYYYVGIYLISKFVDEGETDINVSCKRLEEFFKEKCDLSNLDDDTVLVIDTYNLVEIVRIISGVLSVLVNTGIINKNIKAMITDGLLNLNRVCTYKSLKDYCSNLVYWVDYTDDDSVSANTASSHILEVMLHYLWFLPSMEISIMIEDIVAGGETNDDTDTDKED